MWARKMRDKKKTDLEVVKKAKVAALTDDKKAVKNDKPPENPVSDLEIHTVELPPDPKNKNKKSKKGVRNAAKEKRNRDKKGKFIKKQHEIKPKPKKEKNGVQQSGQGNGEKTKIPGVAPKRRPFWPHDF